MGRFLLGVGLLLGLLALSLGVFLAAQQMHVPVSEKLETAAQAALEGDLDEALLQAHRARQLWERKWHGTAAFSDHAPMDEIDSLFAQLETYGQIGRGADMAALCTRISQLIHAIAEAQSPSWWNIL